MANMLKDLLHNLVGPRATRPYPVQKRTPFPQTRGHLQVEIEKCILCKVCALKCPAKAIEVSRDDATLILNPYRCIICGYCVEACPKDCLYFNPEHRQPA